MKHTFFWAAGMSFAAFFTKPALAQDVDEFGAYGGSRERHERHESPQTMAVEIRFGPYPPRIDDEFSNATPFKDVFGDDTRFLLGFEVDWQVLRIPMLGTLGPGFGWGYTKFTGHGFNLDGSRSEEESKLSIMPMYAVGVLRADVIARETEVPLVPYGKLGVGLAPWWSSSGGESSKANGKDGSDVSYGWQFALGLMLLLDNADEDAAAEIDAEAGVNNSYVFAEWYYSDLSGFGSGNTMNVGSNTWMIGIALEM